MVRPILAVDTQFSCSVWNLLEDSGRIFLVPHSFFDFPFFQDFFEKRGVAVMTVTELFNFVVDQNIADDDVDDYLEKACLYFTLSSYNAL